MPIIFKLFFLFYSSTYGIGSQFLTLPFSTKELSIGSHPTFFEHHPLNHSLYDGYQNRPSIFLNQGVWFGEIGLTQVGYNFQNNNSVTHFGFRYSGINDLEFRDATPSDRPLSYFSSFGLSLDAGRSFKRGQHRYGLSISYVYYGIFTFESKGIGLNFGYSIDLKNKIKLGGVIHNLGKMTKLQTNEILLPQRIILGVSKEVNISQAINFIYASVEKNVLVPSPKIHLGNHLNWDRFNFYSGISSSKKVLETSIGFGVLINRFEVMYAMRYGSQNVGIPQFISIRFLLK